MSIEIVNDYSSSGLISSLANQKLVLYGAGTAVSSYARISYAALAHIGITPHCFIDDDEKRVGHEFLGIPIYSPSYITEKNDKFVVMISSNYFSSILNTLNSIKFTGDVYSLSSLLRQSKPEAFDGLMSYAEVQRRLHTHNCKLERINANSSPARALVFNALDIEVTEKCSMKCIDCSNLMQYYARPIDSDIRILMESLEKIFDAVDRIDDARVLGGEPFMFRALPEVLNFLTKQKKTPRITVYSNGTFVPRDDILESLKDPKIEVEITDYDDLSKKHQQMIDVFNKLGIRFITHKPQNWTDSARIVKNNKGPAELQEMFEKCCVNDAITLLHGRLYHCPFSANAYNLKAIPVDQTDFIDLASASNSITVREMISKFYYGKPYLSACGNCLGRDYSQQTVVPGIQTKTAIPIPNIEI